jgi:hypothetical protein
MAPDWFQRVAWVLHRFDPGVRVLLLPARDGPSGLVELALGMNGAGDPYRRDLPGGRGLLDPRRRRGLPPEHDGVIAEHNAREPLQRR